MSSDPSDVAATVEARLAYLLAKNPCVVYTCSAEPPYGATYVSPNITDQFGYDASEFVGHPEFWIERVHPDDVRGILAGIPVLMETDAISHEYRFRRRDGSYLWVQDVLRIERDERGTPIEMVGMWLDISARRATAERLAASEARYRRMVETAAEGVWLLDVHYCTEYANKQTAEILGYTPEEMLGRSVLDFLFPEDREAARGRLSNRFQGVLSRRETRMRTRTGEERWIHLSSTVVRDDAGVAAGVLGMLTDVTERRHTEAERDRLLVAEQAARGLAERANERLTLIAHVSEAITLTLDPLEAADAVTALVAKDYCDGCTVVLADEGAISHLAVTSVDGPFAAALRGGAWRSQVARWAPDNMMFRALRDGGSVLVADASREQIDAWSAEFPTLPRLDMTSGMVVPLRDRGHLLGVMTLWQSQSRRHFDGEDLLLAEDLGRRVAQALDNAHLYQELERSDRNKDQFLALLGHELRNPMAPIVNAVEFLERAPADDSRRAAALATIKRQARQESSLIDDLLNVTRIARGKLLLRMEPTDLAALVRDVLADFGHELKAAGLALDVELPRQAVIVRGDPTRLAQVVGNLLTNALKFTDAGCRISVRVDEPRGDNTARVTVRDTGVGIAPELLERIFEPFAQSEDTRSRSRGGLGLGLALSRGLVELHGGTITATSEGPGRGAEVSFVLPRALGVSVEQAPPAATRSGFGGLRVLVVEDNRDAAETMRDLLELLGAEVTLTFNGTTGIAAAIAAPPRLVLCDIGLPDMSGHDVAMRLRREPLLAATRHVAVTGYGQDDDRRRAHEAGFDAHVVKPVLPEQLERIVSELVRANP